MEIKTINKIVWWIPFKKLRNKFRNYLLNNHHIELDFLNLHIAEHCNLNCYGCSVYSQLAKETYYDINIFEKDIKRMSELTNGNIKLVLLIGGEPLLNKNIKEYTYITRKYFTKSDICIFTNGILLPKQDESFYKALQDNKIGIIVSKYPINVNFESVISICKDKNIYFGFTEDTDQGNEKYSRRMSLDLNGKQDIYHSFKNCISNNCYKVSNGKFYMCGNVSTINYFNDYFNVNLEVTEKDYLDIYKTNIKELKNYISNPIPFCRYCIRPHEVVGKWRTSKRTIDEYVINNM